MTVLAVPIVLVAAITATAAIPAGGAAAAGGAGPPGTGRVAGPGGTSTATTTPATLVVAARRAQRMQGFGASGAWVGDDLVHFPASARRRLGTLLFGRRGIELSGYRYNVGGGGVGVTNPVRAPQSFLTASGSYDWSADPGGRALLALAHRHGVPELTAFVNSAPARWTTNGENCGGSLRSDPAAMRADARYLATVVRHFEVATGITIRYVSPMNEPDDSFSQCAQEGMAVPVDQRAALVRDVGRALAARAPWAHVVADESATATIQLLHEAPDWLDAKTARWMAAVATHGYAFPTPVELRPVRVLGRSLHLPVWNTEICCNDGQTGVGGFGQRYDPTMASGIWLADTIWQDLVAGGESAFYWWSAASPSLGCDPHGDPSCATTVNSTGWDDGLLYYDPHYAADHDYRLYTTKRFYVMGNFSRYVRPGAVRHPIRGGPAGVRALGFSRGHRWTVVLVDDATSGGQTPVHLRLPVRAHPTGGAVTGPSRDLAPVHGVVGSGHAFRVEVSPQSVTTLTFTATGG